MSVCYVILESCGEYSDRSVTPVFVTFSEDKAKEIVEQKTHEAIMDQGKNNYLNDLHNEFIQSKIFTIPYPVYTIEHPKFDKSREKDKNYIKEWMKTKEKYYNDFNTWTKTVLVEWNLDKNVAKEKYIEDHYDESKIISSEWSEKSYYYETVECD